MRNTTVASFLKKLSILIWSAACVWPAFTQSLVSTRLFSSEDGYTQHVVNQIVQDRDGFVWLATRNGLERYDGYGFRSFRNDADGKDHAVSSYFSEVFPGSRYHLWCITYDRRLSLFNTKTLRFEDIPFYAEDFGQNVLKIYPLANGITWMQCRSALWRIDESQISRPSAVVRYPTDRIGEQLNIVFLDRYGNEWLLGNQHTLCLAQGRVLEFEPADFVAETSERLYIAREDGYLAWYDYQTHRFSTYSSDTPLNQMTGLYVLPDDRLAVVRLRGLSLIGPQNKVRHDNFFIGFGPECYSDSQGRFWILRSNGDVVLYRLSDGRHRNMEYPKIDGINSYFRFRIFVEDDYGTVWIKPRDGEFCYFEPENKRLEQAYVYSEGIRVPLQVRSNIFLADRQHNLWFYGNDTLEEYCFGRRKTDFIAPPRPAQARAVEEDHLQRLWVGWKTDAENNRGLVCLYDSTQQFLGYLHEDGSIGDDRDRLLDADVYCIHEDSRHRLWIGSKHRGLYLLTPKEDNSFSVRHYTGSDDMDGPLPSDAIYDILEDAHGRHWLACFGGGVVLAEERHGTDRLRFLSYENGLSGYPGQCREVRCLAQTRDGVLLAGTNNGLLAFSDVFRQPEDIVFFHYSSKTENANPADDNIYNVFQSEDGRVWLASESSGMIYADEQDLLSRVDGFPRFHAFLSSDLALAMTEDNNHGLWAVSGNKLSFFDPSGRLLSETEGLRMTEARPKCLRSGLLAVATATSLMLVHPDNFIPDTYRPSIAFTQVRVFRRDTTVVRPVCQDKILRLGRGERTCQILFSALDFKPGCRIEYAWRLRGIADQWIELGDLRYAQLVNVPPGRRLLEVRSTNADGQWTDNVTGLTLQVLPRFTETLWFYMLLVLAVAALIWLVLGYINRMMDLRRRMETEKQINESKMRLFTEASHELRTPLTLIEAPVEEVLAREKLSDKARTNLQIVQQNARKMQQLVNQILETRKIQVGQMKLRLEKTDVLPLITRVFDEFRPTSVSRQIDYRLICLLSSCTMYTDTEKLEQILTNLLSNAFKYTPPGKRVTLTVGMEAETLCLEVMDEGRGISETDLKRIFRPFETLDEADPSVSTGLGLVLVKEQTERLHGQVKVRSRLGQGSTFCVSLPGRLEVFREDGMMTLIEDKERSSERTENTGDRTAASQAVSDRPVILIIEDNEELRRFLAGLLEDDYQILEADNGRTGLTVTEQQGPDLVLSDIMMPEMDGLEYLKAIRSDHRMSHIPLLFLSARTSVQSQIEGLEYGADDYLTKPFSADYLRAKIQSVFDRRRRLYELFSEKGALPAYDDQTGRQSSQGVLSEYDSRFLQDLIGCVDENLQNPEFSIDSLASGFYMSRSVFYRKLKSLTGMAPVDFVNRRRIRLACQLIDDGRASFSEIAWQCGFSSPQYFTRVFKREKGCTPSDYRARH